MNRRKELHLINEAYNSVTYNRYKEIELEGFKIITPDKYKNILVQEREDIDNWFILTVKELHSMGNVMGTGEVYTKPLDRIAKLWEKAIIIDARKVHLFTSTLYRFPIVKETRNVYLKYDSKYEDIPESKKAGLLSAGGLNAYLEPTESFRDYASKETADDFSKLMDEL